MTGAHQRPHPDGFLSRVRAERPIERKEQNGPLTPVFPYQNVVRNPNCAVRGWNAMFESYCGCRKFAAASFVTNAL